MPVTHDPSQAVKDLAMYTTKEIFQGKIERNGRYQMVGVLYVSYF